MREDIYIILFFKVDVNFKITIEKNKKKIKKDKGT
jgi:hypothetical protein